MKKTFTLMVAALAAFGANAQLAKKYAYFEHFTQASCGPCAAQNPTFQSNVLNYYTDGVHHVAYHTSWPGVDPMNSHNAPQVQSRVTYYGVNGVPNMQMNGKNMGSPANVSRKNVDDVFAEGSPIKVDVDQTFNNDTFYVKVTVTTVGDKPSGTYKLVCAMVENEIVYSSAPGTNGEKDFPNVFRRMASADNGDNINLPEKGQSIEFNYAVASRSPWVNENIYSLAAVQASDKSVLNSGASTDISSPITYGLLGAPAKLVAAGNPGTGTTFNYSIKNTGSQAENFKFTLSSDMPNDWSASFMVSGTSITNETVVNLPAGADINGVLTVNPGATPYVGSFSVTMESADNAGTIKFSKSVQVISNVRDLVISHTANAGSKKPSDWASIYTNGISAAGNTVNATSDSKFLADAFKENALSGVKSIYFNIGWSFGALTTEMITNLKSFIDNGGNLMMAGQDVAWENMDPQGLNYSANAVDFLQNYMHIGYSADHAQSTSLIAATGEYFESLGTSAISNTFYGTAANSYYPDRITTMNGGIATFHYDAAKTKVGGVRFADNTKKSKVVFLAVGPEQFSDNAKKEEFAKLTHDYFYSSVGIKKNKEDMAHLLGEAYPNPAKDFVTFSFGALENDMTLTITDLSGKVVYTQGVWAGMSQTTVNTENLQSGIYFYQLLDGNAVVATKKLTITK